MEAALILALAVATTALIGTAIWKKSTAAEREALEKVAPLLDGALSRQRELLDLNSGYLMKRDWDAARAESQALYDALSKVREELLEDHQRAADIAEFMRIHTDDGIRAVRNAKYKEAELAAAKAHEFPFQPPHGSPLVDGCEIAREIIMDEVSGAPPPPPGAPQVLGEPKPRELRPLSLQGGRVVVDKAAGQKRHERVLAERLLHDAIPELHGRDEPRLAPLVQDEVLRRALPVGSVAKFPGQLCAVERAPEREPLHRLLPDDAALALDARLEKRAGVGHELVVDAP